MLSVLNYLGTKKLATYAQKPVRIKMIEPERNVQKPQWDKIMIVVEMYWGNNNMFGSPGKGL
eukprot:1235109-Ditylum_brightwellii.AAC.1